MEVKMNWIPFAILAKHAINAAARYDKEQSARFRCRICWTNYHTTEEHLHPQLSAKKKAELKRCQTALPFLLAALVGILAYFMHTTWFQTVVEWLIVWPVWTWALAYRFRREQREENERMYGLQG
jgi:hypothetical protein